MMEAYCPLCGVILQTFAAQPPVDDLPWIAEIRAVKSVRGTSLPFITGVGYMSPDNELIAHPDETVRYSDSIEGIESSAFHHISGEYWAFPFHDVCWSLLLSRIAEQGHDSAQVARYLFQILYCTPWNTYYAALCGHDYGGASEFHQGPGHPGYSAPLPSKWSFLVADPREYPSTNSQRNNVLGRPAISISHFDQFNSTDVFCALPDEVIVLILNDLTSMDVCSLRQSSKKVASISSFQQLPQSFWATRFQKDHEMGFALACQSPFGLEKHPDWRSLYIVFKNSLQNSNEGLGIKNRRRIWHVLSNVSKTLNDLMNNEPVQQNEKLKDHQYPDRCICSPIISAEFISESQATEVLRIGSRKLIVDRLQWPRSDSPAQMKIGVSFTWFNGRSYVSGLRTWQSDSPCGSDKSQRLGLIIPSAEKIIGFDPHLLDGLEIALTISGIIGLRFLTQSVSGGFAYTLGDFATTTSDVGIAKLLRRRESQTFAIEMSFDVCKLLSVQFIEQYCSDLCCGTISPNVIPPLCRTHSTKDPSNIVGKIWYPEIPNQDNCIQSFPAKTRAQKFSIHLNMDFAGHGRRRLSSLQRIVALIGDMPSLFRGLEFVYDDGGSKRFHTEQHMFSFRCDTVKFVESSFYIDSAAGERISAVKVGCTTSLLGIKCIELYTNTGRHTFFGIDHESSSEDPVDDFSILKPPDNTMITGFVATLGALDGSFKKFGIQCQTYEHFRLPTIQSTPSSSSQKFSVKRAAREKASSVMGTGYVVQTTASLSNVRRIRVSFGVKGHSRLPESISGLWLEYFKSDRPSIVGQWLDESGAFELLLGENFTEISIWTSNEHTAAYSGSAKLGKVIALRFDTSGGRSLQFGQECTEGAVHLSFIANMFEKLDTICWAFNTRWDHAMIRYSPQPSQAHRALHLIGCHVNPWMVPEKLFWTIQDTDDKRSSVSSINISLIPDAIVGLSFTYTSGHTCILGSTEGKTSTLSLAHGETLIRLDIALATVKNIASVVLISIHTNYKRILTFRSQTYFEAEAMTPQVFPPCPSTSIPPPPPMLPPTVRSCDPDYVFSLHPSSDVSHAAHNYEAFEFPTDAEDFVGFWGIVGRRERRLQRLGPIFAGTRRE